MRAVTMTVIEIGGASFTFCAAHTGFHDGEFEPLHGHTFAPTLRITGLGWRCEPSGGWLGVPAGPQEDS